MNIRATTTTDLNAVLALVPRLTTAGSPPGRDVSQIEASDTKSITQAIIHPLLERDFSLLKRSAA
jgi:hypothetical protein